VVVATKAFRFFKIFFKFKTIGEKKARRLRRKSSAVDPDGGTLRKFKRPIANSPQNITRDKKIRREQPKRRRTNSRNGRGIRSEVSDHPQKAGRLMTNTAHAAFESAPAHQAFSRHQGRNFHGEVFGAG